MAVSTLVATPGSASANTYCLLTVANQYHEDRPAVGTTWSSATDAQKNAALLWATKLLDANYVWNGYVVDSTQSLLFPRTGLLDINEVDILSWTEIPIQLQWATAEFARQLLAADRASDSDIETQGITSIKAGSIALTFKDCGVFAKVIPDAVVNLIPRHWGYISSYETRELERA